MSPSGPISLHDGHIELQNPSGEISGHGHVEMVLRPAPKLSFDIPKPSYNGRQDAREINQNLKLFLNGKKNQSADAFITNWGQGVRGLVNSYESEPRDDLAEVGFSLLNLPLAGPLRLNFAGWQVNLRAVTLPQGQRVSSVLQEGTAITHEGRLTRSDGSTFTSQDARGFFEDFYFGLSFCTGMWSAPIVWTGFDAQKQVVWRVWEAWRAQAANAESWWTPAFATGLQGVLEGYFNVAADPLWSDDIAIPIHWYVECVSGTGPMEGKIVWVQAALELLTWIYFVGEKQPPEAPKAFANKSAAARLRMLLQEVGVPAAIPTQLSQLIASTSTLGPEQQDGPGMFTYIRNGVVHPEIRDRAFRTPVDQLREAHTLGLQYLELVLLWLFKYRGVYSNRLIPGRNAHDGTPVPWA